VSSILLDKVLQRLLPRHVQRMARAMEIRTRTEFPRRCMLMGTTGKMGLMFEVTIEARQGPILQKLALSIAPASDYSPSASLAKARQCLGCGMRRPLRISVA